MERLACVALPDLSLQILLRDRPSWRSSPVAVVEDDRPEARLTVLNELARRSRLRPGLRQGAARGVVPSLRTAVVPASQVRELCDDLLKGLLTFSPRVEPDEPGIFLVDPSGLGRLYGGHPAWAATVHGYLRGRGFRGAVVVGFSRYRCMAVARMRLGAHVLASRDEEQQLAAEVPLTHLSLGPELRDALSTLDVVTLGDFLALPAGDIAARLGPEASRLHGLYLESPQLPMQPHRAVEPVEVELAIEPPCADLARLLFGIKGGLHEVMRALRSRREALAALRITLSTEGGEHHAERIAVATPTRDALAVLELVRLHLTGRELPGAVASVTLVGEAARADPDQLRVTGETPRRDPAAARRAVARVRAAFGADAVSRARLREAHLPEASFRWEPAFEAPAPAQPAPGVEVSSPALVRRVLCRPRPLAPRSPAAPEQGPEPPRGHEPILRLYGPYRVSGGWWVREVERDYYYAETGSGVVLWVYFDRPRRRWFLHGLVD